jgi:nucleotide-binding universal stress UspA family protein
VVDVAMLHSGVVSTKWLVGIDESAGARSALQWAVRVADAGGDRVVPLTAWRLPPSMLLTLGRRPSDLDGVRDRADLMAQRTVQAVGDHRVMDPLVVVEGHPADALLGHADSDTVVVVGRCRADGRKHLLSGSVSRYVATHASTPVVLVPEGWRARPLTRIIVGFDGSDYATAALRWAVEVAPPTSVVTALIAIDVIPWLAPEVVAERHPDDVAAARQRLLDAADVADPRQRADREVVLHGARQALAEACGTADLVVVGPRGLGGVARAFLGSVSAWLVHDALCPVAVVPLPAPSQQRSSSGRSSRRADAEPVGAR